MPAEALQPGIKKSNKRKKVDKDGLHAILTNLPLTVHLMNFLRPCWLKSQACVTCDLNS